MRAIATGVLLFFAGGMHAQNAASGLPEALGSVAGHVILGDTQRPAAFAAVYLIPTHLDATDAGLSQAQIQTALDGSFRASSVPVGDYYVVGKLAGYIIPLTAIPHLARSDKGRDAAAAQLLVRLPTVHVSENRNTDVTITLQRGAVFTGRVMLEDGTPLIGQSVKLLNSGGDGFQQSASAGLGMMFWGLRNVVTDDEGRFRFAGIAEGKYTVEVDLQPEMNLQAGKSRDGRRTYTDSGQTMSVFAPNAFSFKDAKVFEVKSVNTPIQADIEVQLSKTHMVSGILVASGDGHKLHRGVVQLIEQPGGGVWRGVSVSSDGTFHFDFVPEGTYTLKANGDEGSNQDSTPMKGYTPASTTVIVSSHDVVMEPVTLAPAKTAAP